MGHRLTPHTVDSEDELRALLGAPNEVVRSKVSDRLNALTRRFVERSPFVCLSTSAPGGACDVSPRGDPAGFVRVLDDATLLVPERPGNKLADSLRNILANPHVGLLFLIPGVGDSFRVNGRATLTTDAALLADSAVEGKVPKLGIIVDVEEAYTHCSKAALRSDLWNPARHVDRSALPSSGAILRELNGGGFDAETYEAERAARYARREGFYLAPRLDRERGERRFCGSGAGGPRASGRNRRPSRRGRESMRGPVGQPCRARSRAPSGTSSSVEQHQVELRDAGGVGEHVDRDDLVALKGEGEDGAGVPARRPHRRRGSVHERRLRRAGAPRERLGHGRRAADLARQHPAGRGLGPPLEYLTAAPRARAAPCGDTRRPRAACASGALRRHPTAAPPARG